MHVTARSRRSVLYYKLIVRLISPRGRRILLVVFDELLRVVRGEGLPSVFMQLLRDIIRALFLNWEICILGALVKERVGNNVPLIRKQGKDTLFFPFLVRGFV